MSIEPFLSSTAQEFVTELEMVREKYPSHALVLVEGRTDLALLLEYKHDDCQLIDSGSKEKALRVIEIIKEEGRLEGVAAIIDLDCWVVTGSHWLDNANVLYDDMPDMETVVFESNALEKYLRNAMTGKDYALVAAFAQNLRSRATEIGTEFGYFRTVHCLQPTRSLKLSALEGEITALVDLDTLYVDRMTVAVRLTEETTETNPQQLLEDVDRIAMEYADDAYRRGKDTLSITVHIFETVFRQSFADEDLLRNLTHELAPRPRSAPFTTLFERLRAAFEFLHFAATALYRRIINWQDRNNPFRIIRNPALERTPA